jgi:hypothetical protein
MVRRAGAGRVAGPWGDLTSGGRLSARAGDVLTSRAPCRPFRGASADGVDALAHPIATVDVKRLRNDVIAVA